MSCGTARRIEELSFEDSLVHRLDARTKLIFLSIYCLTAASFPLYETAALVPLSAFPLIFIAVGKIPLRLVLRMLILLSPFVLLVAGLNPLLDAGLVRIRGTEVSVPAGWISLASVAIRFVLAVSMTVAFTATTPLPSVVNALHGLRMPELLVTQIHLICRFLFLLADRAEAMTHSWRLRSPGRRTADIPTASKMICALLAGTYVRAEAVYLSMKARGFSGRMPEPAGPSGIRPGDLLFLLAGTAFCAAARFLPLTDWTGAAAAKILGV